MNEWVSTKNRLPESNTQVLVYNGNFGVCWYKPLNVAATWHDGDGSWVGVKFWMSLPERPK